jgi:hypothetical protein
MIPKKNLQLYHKLDDGIIIQWTWNCRPYKKVFWKTWKPTIDNVQILTGLTESTEADTIRQEILDEVLRKEFPSKDESKLKNIFSRR